MAGKRKRKPISPELRAEWAEARRQLERAIARSEEQTTKRRRVQARRRARVRLWTLGLLGHEPDIPVTSESESPRERLGRLIARSEERVARHRALEERRRARLRQWSFGLLGRESRLSD